MVRSMTPFQCVTISSASVKKIFLAGPTGHGGVLAKGTQRVTIVNNDDTNFIEIGYVTDSSDTAPTTGNMDKIKPGDAREFEAPQNQLRKLYAKADTADCKASIWSSEREIGG